MDRSPVTVNETFLSEVRRNVQAAIDEDVGLGDINAALISKERIATARLTTRTAGVFCGQLWAEETCHQLDSSITTQWMVQDGQTVQPGDTLLVVQGAARDARLLRRLRGPGMGQRRCLPAVCLAG